MQSQIAARVSGRRELAKIFKPFYSTKVRGLGLGLAGRSFVQSAAIQANQTDMRETCDTPSNLSHLAIHGALTDGTIAEAEQLALKYQLISPSTRYIVVAERAEDEKAKELPSLRK